MYGYIYLITNLINGHRYIGQHKYNKPELDPNYFGSGKLLENKIKQYGKENFKIELLDICNSLDELNEAEKQNIYKYRTYIDWHEGGYNLTIGGDGVESLCEESKSKMIESNKKTWSSPNMKQTVSKRRKGIKASEETKKKMSESHKGIFAGDNHPMYGKNLSEETKKKISIANSGENNGFYGKCHTEETKKKMRESQRKRRQKEKELKSNI